MIPCSMLPDLLGLQGHPGRLPGGDGDLCPGDVAQEQTAFGDDGDEECQDGQDDLPPADMMGRIFPAQLCFCKHIRVACLFSFNKTL